jgi:hypothetical protein
LLRKTVAEKTGSCGVLNPIGCKEKREDGSSKNAQNEKADDALYEREALLTRASTK